MSNQTTNSTAPVLHPCRDEAAGELSRERALWELLELLFIHLTENTASDLITCRDEAAAELSRERALWELLELFFVQPPTAHGTAAEVGGWTPDPGSSST